jgi:hypothetical protein
LKNALAYYVQKRQFWNTCFSFDLTPI